MRSGFRLGRDWIGSQRFTGITPPPALWEMPTRSLFVIAFVYKIVVHMIACFVANVNKQVEINGKKRETEKRGKDIAILENLW